MADADDKKPKKKTAKKKSSTKPKKKTKKNGEPHPTSTGKVVNVPVDTTNWRKQVQESRIKFDDNQKDIYLRVLAETGLKGKAAAEAGVCLQTVRDHIEIDPEFENAVEKAFASYTTLLSQEVHRRGVEGWDEPLYHKGMRVMDVALDEEGNVIYEDYEDPKTGEIEQRPKLIPVVIRKFSDRLLELQAKRFESEYRDKQTIDLNTGGGVLVAPAEMTPEEWIAREEEENKKRLAPPMTIEGEATRLDE